MRGACDILPRPNPQPIRNLRNLILALVDCFFVRIHLKAENAAASRAPPDTSADPGFGDEITINL